MTISSARGGGATHTISLLFCLAGLLVGGLVVPGAQAVVYMAIAAKSNAVYMAFKAAMRDARESGSLDVPLHLRNAPTKLMKELDYGKAYRYAHDEPDAYAAGETYFPEELGERCYYHPVDRGLEIRVAEKMAWFREQDRRARRSEESS